MRGNPISRWKKSRFSHAATARKYCCARIHRADAGDFFDQLTEHDESRIAVDEAHPRRSDQLFLIDFREQSSFSDLRCLDRRIGSQAARMRQQHAQR